VPDLDRNHWTRSHRPRSTHDELAERRPAARRPGHALAAGPGGRHRDVHQDHSGDHNPLHHDQDAARASRFGEIIVQGGVTSAILNAVVAERLPGPGTVFLQVDWRFLAPVRPGDEITGAVEVLEVRQDKPITKLRTAVSRQDGTVVLDGTAVCYTTSLTGD
jgi:acyl dehydratase